MGIVKHRVVWWGLAFSLCGWAAAAEGPARTENAAPAEERDLGIRFASCLVKVTTDPAVLPLSQEAIDSMFRSPRVFGESAGKIFIAVPRNDATVLRIRVLSVGMRPAIDEDLRSDNRETGAIWPEEPPIIRQVPILAQLFRRDLRAGSPEARAVVYPDLSGAQSTLLFKVTVELPDDVKLKPEVAQFDAEVEKYPPDRKPSARLFMKGLISHFQTLLLNVSEEEKHRVQGQIRTAAEEVELAERKLADIQIELRGPSTSYSLSQGTIRNEIAAMQAELESLRLKQATDTAFRQTLLGRIEEVRGKVDQSPVKDPITTELEKIVANRTQQLQLYEELVKNNTAPLNAVDAARYDVAKAQIDLLQRREELGRKAGNQELEGLTSKLAELALQTMQTESRIRSLEEESGERRPCCPMRTPTSAGVYARRSPNVPWRWRSLDSTERSNVCA